MVAPRLLAPAHPVTAMCPCVLPMKDSLMLPTESRAIRSCASAELPTSCADHPYSRFVRFSTMTANCVLSLVQAFAIKALAKTCGTDNIVSRLRAFDEVHANRHVVLRPSVVPNLFTRTFSEADMPFSDFR